MDRAQAHAGQAPQALAGVHLARILGIDGADRQLQHATVRSGCSVDIFRAHWVGSAALPVGTVAGDGSLGQGRDALLELLSELFAESFGLGKVALVRAAVAISLVSECSPDQAAAAMTAKPFSVIRSSISTRQSS